MSRLPPLLVLLLLLAGCSSPPPSPAEAPAAPALDPALQQALAGSVQNATDATALTAETPLLLQVSSGPDAPLAAYRWPLPEGSVVDLDGSSADVLRFAVAPVGAEGVDLQEHALLAFGLGRTVRLLGGVAATPLSGSMGTLLGQAPFEEPAAPLEPRILTLAPHDLQEGEGIGFVFAGRSATPRSFGLLVAPVLDGGAEAEPPADATELLRGRQAVALAPSGLGSGLQVADYVQAKAFLPTMHDLAFEVRTPAVSVEDAVPAGGEPAATAQDRTVSAAFGGRGFSQAMAIAVQSGVVAGGCPWAGTYEVAADLHGTAATHRNVLAGAGPGILPFGLPWMTAAGAGDGGASMRLHLRHAAACTHTVTLFSQLDLGATPGDLFGAELAGEAWAFEAALGDLPPVLAADDGDLVLGGPAAPLRLLGAARGLPDGAFAV